MAYDRIRKSLAVVTLEDKYFQNFVDNEMTDDLVQDCVESSDFAQCLRELIPTLGHLIKFRKAFISNPNIKTVPIKLENANSQSQLSANTNAAEAIEDRMKWNSRTKNSDSRGAESTGVCSAAKIPRLGEGCVKSQQSEEDAVSTEGNDLVARTLKAYRQKLKSRMTMNEELFLKSNSVALETFMVEIKNAFMGKDEGAVKLVCRDFNIKAKRVFEEMLHLLRERLENLMSRTTHAKDNAVKNYSKEMSKLFLGEEKTPIDVEELKCKHEVEKSRARNEFLIFFQSFFVPKYPDQKDILGGFVKELEEEIEESYQTNFRNKNQLLMDKHQLVLENHDTKTRAELHKSWTSIKDRYGKQVKQIADEASEENDFDAAESKLRHACVRELVEKCDRAMSPVETADQLLTELRAYMESVFNDTKKVFQMTREEEKNLVKDVLQKAHVYYKEEMDKYFESKDWLSEKELLRIHETIKKAALEKAKLQKALHSDQEMQLRDTLAQLFKSYSEKNLLRIPKDTYPIGIDLGTTNSCVAVCMKGKVKIISDVNDKPTVPSYVRISSETGISVGEPAKDQAFLFPENTIFDIKRLIGRRFNDEAIQEDLKLWPFRVVPKNNQPVVEIKGNFPYRPEEISALILSHLKLMAERYLGHVVKDAVVTVPAYFNDSQRQATKDAAKLVNLNARILSEPTAAAIAFQLQRTGDLRRNILVFDLGGGTFDVAVVVVAGVKVTAKAIRGDTHLGGEDFDNNVVKYVIQTVLEKDDINLERGRHSTDSSRKERAAERLRRIRSYCEQQKRILSSTSSAVIAIDRIDGNYNLNLTLTREKFEELNMPLFQRCIDITHKVINDANMDRQEIDDVVLVGGSTRIPKLRELLGEYFGGKSLSNTVNADEAVAYGAAVHAAIVFSKPAEVPKTICVKDVTPMSLGVELMDKSLNVIIPRNTQIPCTRRHTFHTASDWQTFVDIHVYEGDYQQIASCNNQLGRFRLSDIPPAPVGREDIIILMTIDNEGILEVRATVRSTLGTKSITIQAFKGRMTQKQINQAKGRIHTAKFS